TKAIPLCVADPPLKPAADAAAGITAGIYEEIQQEMRRAKVSQALFAKVAANKSQSLLVNLKSMQSFLRVPQAERDRVYQEERERASSTSQGLAHSQVAIGPPQRHTQPPGGASEQGGAPFLLLRLSPSGPGVSWDIYRQVREELKRASVSQARMGIS
ncbi:hypothetical protein CRUP_014922, partial [Coryphaenoides rupestris]